MVAGEGLGHDDPALGITQPGDEEGQVSDIGFPSGCHVSTVRWVCGGSSSIREFAHQFEQLCADEDLLELAGEVAQLLDALERSGHEVKGEGSGDPSHPIVTSRLAMFALRRTPPTRFTPYATTPPVIRIPYVWFDDDAGEELAVVMLVGDKTTLANHWYPTKVQHIESDTIIDTGS